MDAVNSHRILPAFCDAPAPPMSSKEFQRTLYTWFEEKGLVADLRSYLRVLMINELRNTSVGKPEPKAAFSLSRQAFSLVVAEHLLREGCHYTLSVFSTEVPAVANQLPFSPFEPRTAGDWRFDEESLLDVLELIGVPKGSSESLRVASAYSRNRDSLLACLVGSRGAAAPDLALEAQRDLGAVLAALGVPPSMVDAIRRSAEEGFARELPLERQRLREAQEALAERNRQVELLIGEQVALKKEGERAKRALREAQRRLKQAAAKEQGVNLRESEMRRKLEEVARLQRSLEKAVSREKEACGLRHCTEACGSVAGENEALKGEVRELERENREKGEEIQRLGAQVVSLTKDLQSSRLNIEFLNTCLLRSSQINLQQGKECSPSSDDTSENLTGEILRQVRSKLQQLERESDELDVKFKKLKMTDFVKK